MSRFITSTLLQPLFPSVVTALLFAVLAATGRLEFVALIQAVTIAAGFHRANLLNEGAGHCCLVWWRAGTIVAGLAVIGGWLLLDPITSIYAAGFVILATVFLRWLFFGRTGDSADILLIGLAVTLALAVSPPTISRISLHLSALSVPSKFELNSTPEAERYHRATRSYALHNLNPINVQLAAGNVRLDDPLPVLQFNPRRDTLFPINRIEYKFLGITIQDLSRTELHAVTLAPDSSPVTLNQTDYGLELTDINGEEQAWLVLPPVDPTLVSTTLKAKITGLKLLIWLLVCGAFWLWQPRQSAIQAAPNPYTPAVRKPLLPWSWWIWGIHAVFVGAMYLYMFTPFKPDWFKMTFSAISLGHEENYAVWWSALCLFIASQLFYKLASIGKTVKDRWVWGILGVALLALAYDEMGSLHEMVSKVAGWEMLLPFALVFMIGFGFSIWSLARQPGYRFPAFLILLGIIVFAMVASLEFVEHNIKMDKFQQRMRLLVEEGSELFAMSLIIIAGLLGMRRMGVDNRRLSEVIGNPSGVALQEHCVLALFALQFFAMALFALPFAGSFSEGNPAAVFPVIMYYSLFLMAIRRGNVTHDRRFWWALAALFLFTSLCQVHGFTKLLNKLELGVTLFSGAPETWAATLVPLAILWGYCLFRREISLSLVLPDLVILAITGALAHTDSTHRFAYHLFSGMVAFLCYRILVRLER